MTSSLFREEAITQQKRKLTGDVIIVQPVSFMVITTCLVVLTLLVTLFLISNSYTRKETVFGQLSPDIGIVRLNAKEFGEIQEVFVIQGETVSAGAPLFRIARDTTSDNGIPITEAMLSQLETEIAEIEGRVPILEEKFANQERELQTRKTSLSIETDDLQSQFLMQKTRESISKNQYQTYRSLLKEDAASQVEVDSAHERWIISQQELNSLERQIADRRAQQTLIDIQLDRLPNDHELAISELRERLAGIEQRRTKLKQQAGYVVTAPLSGRIASLQVKSGQAFVTGDFQAAIMPENAQLVAHLYAPTRAAGFMAPGQPVRIMYDAFPFERFGAAMGVVDNVSTTVLMPQDGPAEIGIMEPVYKVTVVLQKQTVTAYKREFALQDGMTLQADVILDRRTLFEWLFEPLIAMGRR